MNLPCYDLRKPEDLNSALWDLRGFWKFWSACLLSSCGLPTLAGLIITRFYPGMREDLHRFLHEQGSTAALIRHDKHPEAPGHARGGFLVGEELLQDTIGFFFDLGRIVAVYEMADPLLNSYNLNLLFESDSQIWIEIVGPGFDASDLQRGDLSPHETFSVILSADQTISKLELMQRIDDKTYRESIRSRKDKMKTKFEASPAPELARRIQKNLGIPDDLDAYLDRIDSPLSRLQAYRPISETLVRDTVRTVIESNVIASYSDATGAKFPLVISSSLVNRGNKRVFWDIVSPALKFEGLNSKAVGRIAGSS